MGLRRPDVRHAVLGLGVGAEPEFGQAHTDGVHLVEVVRAQAGGEQDRAGVDLHATGLVTVEGHARGDGHGLHGGGHLGKPGGVDLPGRDDPGDATVRVRLEEPDGLLARGVVAEHHVAVRVDERGRHGGAVHVEDPDRRGHLCPQCRRLPDSLDPAAVVDDHGISATHQRFGEVTRQDLPDVDDGSVTSPSRVDHAAWRHHHQAAAFKKEASTIFDDTGGVLASPSTTA